jgi:hypothetical protein
MARSVRAEGADAQQSLGELVAQAMKDVSSLLHYEISLAKSELRLDARRIGIASALGVVGMFGACLIIVLLCFAFAFGLVAAGIWTWAAFLIVAGTVLVLIGLAGLLAYGRIRKVTGMKMTRQTVMDDLSMLRRSETSPNGSGPAITNPRASVETGAKAEIPPGQP